MLGSSNGRWACEAVPFKFEAGLLTLLEAFDYAEDTGSDRWEFAVGIRQLENLGLTETDLRWLVRKGYVEHAREVTVQGDNGRAFRPTGDLTFSRRTCLVLTDGGVFQARSISDKRSLSACDAASHAGKRDAFHEALPYWDTESRELRIDGKTVKRFKWHAVNQEILLSAFQEEGWPTRIDDPLPPQPEQDSKRRLSDTIKCLNRKQANELIHFRGDGTGEGVTWERVAPIARPTGGPSGNQL